MTHQRPLAALVIGLLATMTLPSFAAEAGDDAWRAKIDPWVLDTAARDGAAEFLVVLEAQADLAAARRLATKEGRGRYVFERLRQTAANTQPAVTAELTLLGAETRPFWIANMIWARGSAGIAEAMARRADVRRVAANPWVALEERFDTPRGRLKRGCPPGGVTEGVAHTGAPELWAQGADGTGTVIGGQDTGYDWDHVALIDSYRGWNGAAVDHNYNWHDAIHSGGGVCGADSPEPCDDFGHGTHTMGTMVGLAGASTLGMAPGARWMACRNMDQGNGTPATYAECFQFFLAPTDSSGSNPDPSKAPDVVNNSWSCPPSEGCTDVNVLRTVVENLRAAGIVVVVSAGNGGSSGCSSVSTPAAIYEASFSIGATNFGDAIASFSSRGPVTVDGSGRLKPDVSAPGVNICSTRPGSNYGFSSGTSMSAPHVAGLVALLISAQPCLRGHVDAIEQYIMDTAVPRTIAETCGGVPGSEVPNNTYGWGAVRAVLPGIEACPGTIFVDGFETGDTGGWPSTQP